MAGKRATSYDVAKLAGVSQSAVSRVFSPAGSASAKTRKKVLAAADELGFAPNPIAKSLSLGRSRLAGLVVTQYAQQNYPLALRSAVELMTATGDSLLIQIVDPSDMGDAAVAQLLSKRVDIILCAASLSVETAQACHDADVPLVLINRRLDVAGVDHVCSPNAGVMRDVAKLLRESGAQQTVFLGGGEGNWISTERRRGYLEACGEFGLPLPILVEGRFTYDAGTEAITSLGPSLREIDAVVAANDPMALGAIDVLRNEFGLAVPDDVQVVGHDDIEAARYQSYRLTSVKQDMRTILSKAVDLAYSRLDDRDRPDAEVVVQSTLIRRKTTRP